MSISIQDPTAIALGQRIGEILEERGSAFSIRAFSARIGMSKDMLARMISGDRYISPSELELIANGLSLTVARIKQDDTAGKLEEMRQVIEGQENIDRALSIGLEIKKVAVGCTERCYTSNMLGKAYHELCLYEEAHAEWLQAKEFAHSIMERYKDTEPLYSVMNNLVLSFTERKDYAGLSTLVTQLRSIFEPFPRRLAVLYYSAATTAFHTGNYKEAKTNFVKSLEQFEKVGKVLDVGIALHNVGYADYMLGNYQESKYNYEKAISTLMDFDINRVVTIKDYIKPLIRLGELEKANDMIREGLKILETFDIPSRRAQFLMLHAIVNQDSVAAIKVLESEDSTNELKKIACKFLMDHYGRLGDSENLMRYYVIAGTFGTNKSAIYDETGL